MQNCRIDFCSWCKVAVHLHHNYTVLSLMLAYVLGCIRERNLFAEKYSSRFSGFVIEEKYEDQFYSVVYLFMQYLFFVAAK
jgi:hypothetical protein